MRGNPMFGIRRREFITLLGSAAAWPLSTHAQQLGNQAVIGFLSSGSPRAFAPFVAAFRQGMRELNYIEGRDVSVTHVWAEGQYNELVDAKTIMEFAKQKSYPVRLFQASSEREIEAAFVSATQQKVSALLTTADPFFTTCRDQIVALAERQTMPVVYPWREYVDAGGLMSYGAELTWGYNLIGQYAARILKGEKPSDLPVQQPTKFNLVINLRTAKALGVAMPRILLASADEVIE